MTYYGPELDGVHLPFNFQLIDAPWNARGLAKIIAEYEAALPPGGWPNWVLGNHDRPRVAAKLGEAQARVAAMLLLTLRGTPTLYYGDELGIGHVEIPADRVRDPRELREPGLGLGRDPVRTPMPWDGSANAGFTSGEPWLPLHADWRARNVEGQAADPLSMLSLYRSLLALRGTENALSMGEIALLDAPDGVLAYERSHCGRRLRILLNLTAENRTVRWQGTPLLSTLAGQPEPGMLYPDEGIIIE
jgi:glycosidase